MRVSITIASIAFAIFAGACSEDEPASETPRPSVADEPTVSEAAPALPPIPEDELAALEAIGYIDRAPTDNPSERGVTRTSGGDVAGLNLYGSRDRAEAVLSDMSGEIVHRWDSQRRESWMHVEPLADGALLTITRDLHLAKYDWDSERIWQTPLRVHHDLVVRDDGLILVLVRGRTSTVHRDETMRILCDSVVVVSPEGDVVERHPLLPLFRNHFPVDRLDLLARRLEEGRSQSELLAGGAVGDMLHTNSIDILDHDIEGVAPAGSVLLSFRTLSRIAIISADFGEVLWLWGRRELDGQHDATQLDSGNILVFDNGLKRGAPSRVVEVDASAGEIVWEYEDSELYTRLRGGAQGLSNGNVLITESDEGHVLEVDRSGEVVWEFFNPDVRGTGNSAQRATIYRLNRFASDLFPQLEP